MGGDLFQDLPPPTAAPSQQIVHNSVNSVTEESSPKPPTPPPPAPALKSALKRPKPPPESQPEAAPGKRLRFKTTTDASEKQVIEAMQKIASHIKNPSKFSKASKLAVQLIQAGSVKETTSSYFFTVLEAAMSSLTTCNDPSLRADYHALFSAAQDVAECLSKKQQNLLSAWTISAVWANDLFTDDSFVFSKATGRIKEEITSLPVATEDDDIEEAVALKDETTEGSADEQINKELSPHATNDGCREEEPDPFGLDALISNAPKDNKSKGKKESLSNSRKDDEEEKKIFLRSQREALISCLEIAAKRYKTPWCQTAIDILAKHAFDNISKFTTGQRDAIEKLWASIREQQIRRKQGKSVSGKLDVNAFEQLQQKYASEKISIRHAVGGGGERRCEQWLG
ncbi:hypothetical protein CDL12_18161 [Handroanthus impetiginosus]|uniref:Uncharacterized protein n=1 Tax=Handroanthus impetiginosus TaxID=429701 RepID=A0A2G9GVF7_9LAMI|nr:hypothetical protein CDL12_18161 [Handroanthus impetiginosus]